MIHIADWHFVSREDFRADLLSLAGGPLKVSYIDRQYAELVRDVAAVQREQLPALREIIRLGGVSRVHVEGLCQGDEGLYRAMVATQSDVAESVASLKATLAEILADGGPDEETRRIEAGIESVSASHASDMLPLGAVGRLVIAGELGDVAALEDRAAYRAANPIAADGTVSIDTPAMRARDDAMARILVSAGPLAVVVLGGAHDLTDSLDRASGGTAEYIRVEVRAWREASGR